VNSVFLENIDTVDSEKLARWRSNIFLSDQLMRAPSDYNTRSAMEWIENCRNDANQYFRGVFVNTEPTGTLVGVTRLMFIDKKTQTAELGIFIGDKQYQGCGVGRKALAMTMKRAFQKIGLRKIYLKVRVDNQRAVKLYRSFGFIEEGTMRDHYRVGDRYIDVLCMAKFRPDLL